jgi:uncharacterized membrane protein YfcA
MPTSVVPGTSLFQTVFIAASVTVLQAVTNQTVDAFLALVMLLGGVIGVQYGARFGSKLRGEYLRLLLAGLILAAGAKLLFDLTITPAELYSVGAAPT